MTRYNGLELTPFDITKFQPKAWDILSRSFENKRTASTYLFHGAEGVGRWATAISFAALLNCENPKQENYMKPCGECLSCRRIFSLSSENLHFAFPLPPHKNLEEAAEITANIIEEKKSEPFKIISSESSTNIPIDLARDIKRRLSLKGDKGVTRVVIFYEMEKMRAESADALLKMIEEPPKDTVIIIISRRPEALPITIRSRSQKIRLGRVPVAVGEEYLTTIHKIKDSQARLLMRLSDNSLGRAIEMSQDDTDESSERAVGLLLFKSICEEPAYATASHINDMVNTRNRGAADDLLSLWQSLVRDCVHYAVLGDDDRLVNLDFIRDIKRISGRIPGGMAASRMSADIKNTLEGLRRNVHIQGAVTALALRLKSHLSAAAN